MSCAQSTILSSTQDILPAEVDYWHSTIAVHSGAFCTALLLIHAMEAPGGSGQGETRHKPTGLTNVQCHTPRAGGRSVSLGHTEHLEQVSCGPSCLFQSSHPALAMVSHRQVGGSPNSSSCYCFLINKSLSRTQ